MLDENLPTFYLAGAKDKIKHHATYHLARGGGEPEPAYSLNYADPTTPAAKNCYAVGLFDPYNHDILYGEVLVRPEWSQPTLSLEEIRRNGGVPPPPEPLLPTHFTIQLYNPDQQIKVTTRTSAVLSSERFDFSMPQQTFRAPSTSLLDRSENDPTADANTPKVNFTWKRESKLSRDLVCYMRGKSNDFHSKKKSKEPDITIALFRSLREVTVYESNLQRVETEDPKGLEVVLLLAAATIKDIWFGNMRQVFNITNVEHRRTSGAASQPRPAALVGAPNQRTSPAQQPFPGGNAATGALYTQALPPKPQGQSPAAHAESQQAPQSQRRPTDPPPADPRTQWEIDAETARLKAQVDAEEREIKRREDARRRERERQDAEETKRLRKMVEAEDRERQQRDKEAERETKRLQKLYGSQAGGNARPYTPAGAPTPTQQAPLRPHSTIGVPQYPQYPTPHPQASGALPTQQPARPVGGTSPYLQPGGQGSSTNSGGRSGYLGSMLDLAERQTNKLAKKKSSICSYATIARALALQTISPSCASLQLVRIATRSVASMVGQDQPSASAQRKAQVIREMSYDRALSNTRGASDFSSGRADAPDFGSLTAVLMRQHNLTRFDTGTESQQIPTLPHISGTEGQGEWKINSSALRRAFPNFSHSGSSDEDSVELGRGHKRGINATLRSTQSEDPSASMSLTFPTTGDRWKVKSTPPLKARKSQAAEQGDLRARTMPHDEAQKENRDTDTSGGLYSTRPPPINVSVRESRWGKKQPLGVSNLNTPNKTSALQQAMHGATADTIGSLQPGTLQSFVLPDIPNITELVSGVRRDGTPLFSRSAKPKSRFTTPSAGAAQNARPSYIGVDQVPIPTDEKALYASLQLLQEKVAGLEIDKEQLGKRAEDYELEVLQLRSKLEEVENNNQHSDSGVGYDDEETKTKEWEQEKSQFAINMKTLQKRLDRANKKLINSELTIKNLEQDRDTAHVQLMQAHLGSEELKTETKAVSDEIVKAKRYIDRLNRQWEKRLQKLTLQEGELRSKITRREKAINEMATLARDLWRTRKAITAAETARGRDGQRRKSLDMQPTTARSQSRRRQTLASKATYAESTLDITPSMNQDTQAVFDQDSDYMSFMDGDEIAKLRHVVEEDRARLAKAGIELDVAHPPTLPRKSSLKQVSRQPHHETTRDISVQFDRPTSRGSRMRDDDPLTGEITDIQQTTQHSFHSHRSRRSVAGDELTSAIILPDITLNIHRPMPVSDRNLHPNEDHTLRPAQDPAVALASVLQTLQDEVTQLRAQLAQQQSLYHQHDPALSKRKRKAVFDRMQKLLATIELRSDQIYALYDVLEGQKAENQLMNDDVVEATLRNVGIDPNQVLGKATGTRGSASGLHKSGTMAADEDDMDDDDDELPWEGFETTHSLASFKL